MRILALLGVVAFSGAAHAVCGNGTVEAGESCDDSNVSSGDGCDSSCLVEDGWDCIDASFELLTDEVLLDDSGHSSPSWTISSDNLTVTQSINADAAVYASTLPANGVSIAFDLTVNTTRDDDFIGWVIGYAEGDNTAEDANWLLFDWKQQDQVLSGCTGYAGFTMSQVTGPIVQRADVWCHQGNVVEVSRGDNVGYTGWNDNQTYRVQVDYSTTQVDVYIDGELELSESGIFPAGTFGFYNYSQQDIEYTLVAPLDQSVCSYTDTDGDGLVDLDEVSIGTDETDPDTDGDGLDDFDEYAGVTDPIDEDTDDDGLLDGDEVNTLGTDPIVVDTDGDGLSDGDEVNIHGTDPVDSQSGPDQSCGTAGTVGDGWLEELAVMLPDDTAAPEGMLTDDTGYLCITNEDVGTVLDFTFVAESSTYDSQFGYFLFDPADIEGASAPSPDDVIVAQGTLFGNTSLDDGGTCMDVGDTISVTITSEMVGLSMGFWLRPDGYNTPTAARWFSVDALNDDSPSEHAIITQSSADATVLIGFEDQPRASDACVHDFNDLVVAIEADVAGTLSDCLASSLPEISGDSDGDGVPDGYDDFPSDSSQAIANVYPPGGRLQTIGFEDLYPSVGDGDYNDLVVGVRSAEILNASNEVVALRGVAVVLTRGASLDHEFHIRIPGSGSGDWSVERYDGDGALVSTDSGSSTASDVDITLIESTKAAMPSQNTLAGHPIERGWRVWWTFTPDGALSYDELGVAPYDPFIVVIDNGYDIHLPTFSPVPGSNAPDTDYLDKNNYPWALSVPHRWRPPEERVFIEDDNAYPSFEAWRTSGGTQSADWYESPGSECVELPSDFYDTEVQ